jgi:hypothetical protein
MYFHFTRFHRHANRARPVVGELRHAFQCPA